MCALTSQHVGGHSFDGSTGKRKMSKITDVQFRKMTPDFGIFSSLLKGKNPLFLFWTAGLSCFNSVNPPYKMLLLALCFPLVSVTLALGLPYQGPIYSMLQDTNFDKKPAKQRNCDGIN